MNSKGYLLDERGNIIDKAGEIIWRSHELMYNEPPKIFPFTEFSLNWIRGHLDRDVTQNPRHDDEFDLDGHRINAMGYRTDHLENVVDVFSGNILFTKEVLQEKFGQESEIPYIFRSGKLRVPNDEIEKELEHRRERAMDRGRRGLLLDGMDGSDMDGLHDLFDKDSNKFGLVNGNLQALRDGSGQFIEDIPMSNE